MKFSFNRICEIFCTSISRFIFVLGVPVDIHIFSFNLVLNMEYLSKLGVFFTSALETRETVPSRLKLHASSSVLSMHTKPSQTTMTISLNAEKPDVFLVENMEDLDTRALVLRVSKHINCCNSSILPSYSISHLSC